VLRRVGNISDELKSPGLFWASMQFTQARGKQLQYGWGVVNVEQTLDDEAKVINNITKPFNFNRAKLPLTLTAECEGKTKRQTE